MPNIAEIVLYFFIYSVIGWLWETIYCSIGAGHFVYRGFLHGPYCPIYGFGVLSVLYLVIPLQESTLELFIFSSVIVTILEYITGFFLERIFKVTLWNYNDVPMNIHGRVAVPVSLFWGFCCVLVVRRIQPAIAALVLWLYARCGLWLPAAVVILLTVDTALSASKMFAFSKLMERLAAEFEESREIIRFRRLELQTRREERREMVRRKIEEIFPQLRGFDKHILRTFPDIEMKKIKSFKDFKENLKNYLNTAE